MTRLGRSYAEAFLDSAPAGHDTEGFLESAGALRAALAQERVRTFFLAPAVPLPVKRNVLDELASRAQVDDFGRRFFHVVLENRRIGNVGEILSAVANAYDRRRGVVEARVAVASSIDESEKKRMADALSQRVGKSVRVILETDPRILGGFVARIGSEVFDASTARAIERFAENVKERAKA